MNLAAGLFRDNAHEHSANRFQDRLHFDTRIIVNHSLTVVARFFDRACLLYVKYCIIELLIWTHAITCHSSQPIFTFS